MNRGPKKRKRFAKTGLTVAFHCQLSSQQWKATYDVSLKGQLRPPDKV